MYDRTVDGRTLTFVVSGKLWNDSLVMQDEQTGSLWSHLLGEARKGPLSGKKLTVVPALMTTWQQWQQLHPESTVLLMERTSNSFRRQFISKPDEMKFFVVGLAIDRTARCWPLDRLHQSPLLNDQLGTRPLLVFFDREQTSAFVYDRRLNGQTLTFELQAGDVVDTQTGSRWDARRGRAVDGPLADQKLKRLPYMLSIRRAWTDFHPSGTVWGE